MYLIPWFQYTVIHLGPIPIRVWGLFVALGMALALLGDKDYAELQDNEVANESQRLALYLANYAISKKRGMLIARIRQAETQEDANMVQDLTEKLNQSIQL